MCAAPCHERSLPFLIVDCCIRMDIESKLDHIVEPFDQKDGPDLGERQAKTYGVRTLMTSLAIGQKDSIQKSPKRNVERSVFDLQSRKQS